MKIDVSPSQDVKLINAVVLNILIQWRGKEEKRKKCGPEGILYGENATHSSYLIPNDALMVGVRPFAKTINKNGPEGSRLL